MKTALPLAALLLAAPVGAMEIMVPAYFYGAWYDPAQNQWDELTEAARQGARVTAIVNPNSGPGAGPNSDYTRVLADFRAAGGQVLGYVYSCYGDTQCFPGAAAQRPVAEVLAQAAQYRDWYGVDGIFLDEVSGSDATRPYYQQALAGLRALQPGWRVVGNPGTAIAGATASLFDTVVTFEQGQGDYTQLTTSPWVAGAAPSQVAHLHYNVATEAGMRALLAQAAQWGAGAVYITDDLYYPNDPVHNNPFNRLPSYWAAEVQAVLQLPAVPEPGTWGLMALGALGLAGRSARRTRP